MGTVGAVAVLVAILMAVTLTPAVLALVGPRILRRRERPALAAGDDARRRRDHATATEPMSTTRAVDRPRARRRRPARRGRARARRCGSACPTARPSRRTPPASRRTTIQAEKFGDGSNGPLLVVADLPGPVAEDDVVAEQAAVGAAARPGLERRRGRADRRVARTGRPWPSRSSPTARRRASRPRSWSRTCATLTPTTADGGEATLGVAGNASAGIDISDKLSERAAALPRRWWSGSRCSSWSSSSARSWCR